MEFFKSLLAGAVAGASSGGGGSSVIANPTLEGTEEALSGLEVDGTKYKVEGGGGGGSAAPLYVHAVRVLEGSSDQRYYTIIVSKEATPFTVNTLRDYMTACGFVGSTGQYGTSNVYPVAGVAPNEKRVPFGLWTLTTSNTLWASWGDLTSGEIHHGSVGNAWDTVIQIS